jgi:polyhydroxyalkanoate synthesis regulator phasin
MIDLIKKAVLTGIGVASLTREKVEDFSKELIVKGKLTEQEGEKFVKEMLSRAEESRESLKNQTENLVKNAVDKMQLVQTEDIEELKAEIEKLRGEIASLRDGERK